MGHYMSLVFSTPSLSHTHAHTRWHINLLLFRHMVVHMTEMLMTVGWEDGRMQKARVTQSLPNLITNGFMQLAWPMKDRHIRGGPDGQTMFINSCGRLCCVMNGLGVQEKSVFLDQAVRILQLCNLFFFLIQKSWNQSVIWSSRHYLLKNDTFNISSKRTMFFFSLFLKL